VAIIVYSMPVGQALDVCLLGACFGLFPITWIVFNALRISNMTVATGHFAVLRRAWIAGAGLDPVLLASANTSGGMLGKMVSPQNLAIGAAAVGLQGREGDLFRKVLGWSLLLLLLMCVIVYLQSTILDFMVV
jgi:L-lactate permease